MKYCTLCKINEVPQNKSWCAFCTTQYNKKQWAENKEKRSAQNKNWRKENAGKYKEAKYTYYKSERGRIVDLYRSAKRRAKNKNIVFELSTQWIEELWTKQNGKCALTQIEFLIPQERTGGKASPFAPSIDRIDCSKGYTKDNVRLVCVAVNYALNEFGEEIFKQICISYLESLKQK